MEQPPEPTLDDLREEFPGWHFFDGNSSLVYAQRRNTSPPVTLHGEDPTALRDEIQRWEGNRPLRQRAPAPATPGREHPNRLRIVAGRCVARRPL